jgi:nucleoid-associated protein YgaU
MFARVLILAGLAILVWSAVARSSDAHGTRHVVTVRQGDTLWTLAERRYRRGDLREAVWRIEHVNHLAGPDIYVGERLMLP